jgi:hypothetical protein
MLYLHLYVGALPRRRQQPLHLLVVLRQLRVVNQVLQLVRFVYASVRQAR